MTSLGVGAGSDPQRGGGERHCELRTPARDVVQPVRAVPRARRHRRRLLRAAHARAQRRPARHH